MTFARFFNLNLKCSNFAKKLKTYYNACDLKLQLKDNKLHSSTEMYEVQQMEETQKYDKYVKTVHF